MDFISILLIAIALAMDCFAVSIANGVRMPAFQLRPALWIAFSMGAFQALMPVAGWLLGESCLGFIGAFDHWVAFGLLLFLGVKMIIDAFRTDEEAAAESFRVRWTDVVLMGVATSIDALAVGISFAMIEVSILFPVVLIGIVSFLFSMLGTGIGFRFGKLKHLNVRLIGGLVLIAIGVKILLEHTGI